MAGVTLDQPDNILVQACAKLHAVLFYYDERCAEGATSADVYIHVFADVQAQPEDGTRPSLPPVRVSVGLLGNIDYGASGRPLDSFFIGISLTEGTFTAIDMDTGGEDRLFLEATYS